jgi:WhiB family redox-sensing transcriptional regulator
MPANVPAWQKDALCADPGYEASWWFPEREVAKVAVRRARAVCQRCAVQGECLAYALEFGNELPGVWGGTTQIDRKELRKHAATSEPLTDEASIGGLFESDA